MKILVPIDGSDPSIKALEYAIYLLKLANPKIITMEGDNDAPTTPATIANVVTAPSVAP